jgi:hypothetical protein
MDFGRKIFEGTAPEAAASDVVRQAYLGSEGVPVGAAEWQEAVTSDVVTSG